MDGQQEVFAFLEGGALGSTVERIDTHAASVFLTLDKAYKLKRCVRFSFLDFSTLEQRRAALEAELVLNRRTAPMLYRGLVPVTRRDDGSLELGGSGTVVEWLLEMERFPNSMRLDLLAARGALDRALAERLGETIAAFHGRLPPQKGRGGAAGLAAVIAGNARDLRELVPRVLPAALVDTVVQRIDQKFALAAKELDGRRSAGLVRHVHGDLHLGNVVLLDGEPTPFDCLEFDEQLATTDLLYDLAFLLMDFLAHDLPDQANACLQSWSDARLDDRGLGLLPLLIAIRATIRAKVEGYTILLADKAAAGAEHRASAGKYLELARQVLEPRPRRLVAIGGRSGAGKSSLARALAPHIGTPPGALVLRSDVLRKRMYGMPVSEHLPEEAYAPEVSERVFGALAERAERLLQGGCSVVCDAVYGLPAQRARLREVSRAVGAPLVALWLDAPQHVMEARVAARAGDASDADVTIVRRQAEHVTPPAADEGWHKVSAGDALEVVVERARGLVEGLG